MQHTIVVVNLWGVGRSLRTALVGKIEYFVLKFV
jgi:hypothetical protein